MYFLLSKKTNQQVFLKYMKHNHIIQVLLFLHVTWIDLIYELILQNVRRFALSVHGDIEETPFVCIIFL